MRKSLRRASDWVADRWIQWPWLDLVIATAVTASCAWLVEPRSSIDFIGRLGLSDRNDFYGQALQLVSIFAGFASLAFTVYLGFGGKAIVGVNKVAGRQLLRVWIFALVLPWLATLGILLALAFDRGGVGSHNFARWVVFGALLLVVMQLARLAWVFYQLAMLQLAPESVTPSRTISVVPRRRTG